MGAREASVGPSGGRVGSCEIGTFVHQLVQDLLVVQGVPPFLNDFLPRNSPPESASLREMSPSKAISAGPDFVVVLQARPTEVGQILFEEGAVEEEVNVGKVYVRLEVLGGGGEGTLCCLLWQAKNPY